MMEKGKRYRVVYRIKGLHRKDHAFVGDLIGTGTNGDYIFSLRPQSGTSTLAKQNLIKYENVPRTIACGLL